MNLETSFILDNELVMSPEELLKTYLFGVKIQSSTGEELSTDVYKFYIKAAQEEIETYFNLKLIPQVIRETRDYNYDDYVNYGYLRMSYPVVQAYEMIGKFGETEQIAYPKEWLSSKKSNEVPGMFYRNLYLIPNQGGYQQGNNSGVVFNGVFGANLLWRSRINIPNYWHIAYLTGFSKMPTDLLNVIGKLASINLLHIAGDLILGAGIASYSLSLDGLSQSVSSTSSATNAGYGARILGYSDDIKRVLPILESKYRGFSINSL